MKRIFTAAIAAIALAGAIPAKATTFPTLTRIYFAAGAMDNAANNPTWIATVVNCSNLSGQTASVRYQFRRADGTIAAGGTLLLANLATRTVFTEGGLAITSGTEFPTGSFFGGAVEILSTQSAIYCNAMLVDAATPAVVPAGIALHLVRFNPHPGTVE